jgi:hypothetical protein
MTMIPMVLETVKQRRVTWELWQQIRSDRSIPWRLRAQVLNQYRKRAVREWL